MVLPCTVSEILRLVGRKLRIFLPMFPLEFHGEVNQEETKSHGITLW